LITFRLFIFFYTAYYYPYCLLLGILVNFEAHYR